MSEVFSCICDYVAARHFQSQHQYPKTLLALTAGLVVKASTYYYSALMLERLEPALRQLWGFCVMMGVMIAALKIDKQVSYVTGILCSYLQASHLA